MLLTGCRVSAESHLCTAEIQLHAIGQPGRDTYPKEVPVFCPDRAIECQRYGYHRPIVFITANHARSGTRFTIGIEVSLNDVDPCAHLG